MKIKITALLVVITMLCTFSLASCDIADILGTVGEVDLESAVDLLDEENVFKGYVLADDVPYELEYTSNGDGTCAVTGVKINSKYYDEYTFEIPEKSPDGDTVTSIAWGKVFDPITHNTPRYLTMETMDKIEQACENEVDDYKAFLYRKLFAYYTLQDPTAAQSETLKNEMIKSFPFLEYMLMYVLDSSTSKSECLAISVLIDEIIEDCAVTEYKKIISAWVANGMPEEEALSYYGDEYTPRYGYYVTFITRFNIPDSITEITDGSLDNLVVCGETIVGVNVPQDVLRKIVDSIGNVYSKRTEPPAEWGEEELEKYKYKVYWYSETRSEGGNWFKWTFVDGVPTQR